MGGEHHRVQLGQRVVDGQRLPLEVVEAGGRDLPRPEGVDQGVGVVQAARAVLRKTTPSRMAANWSAPIIPVVSGVTGACMEITSERARSSSRLTVGSSA